MKNDKRTDAERNEVRGGGVEEKKHWREQKCISRGIAMFKSFKKLTPLIVKYLAYCSLKVFKK